MRNFRELCLLKYSLLKSSFKRGFSHVKSLKFNRLKMNCLMESILNATITVDVFKNTLNFKRLLICWFKHIV